MSVLGDLMSRLRRSRGPADKVSVPGEHYVNSSELGRRQNTESAAQRVYRQLWVDPDLRQAIIDLRYMDRVDPRVKHIHRRTAAAAVKGGLRLKMKKENQRVRGLWDGFVQRLKLDRRDKLISDARGLVMEGNLPMQWVLGPDNRVIAGVRMPSETLQPLVNAAGVFRDLNAAYRQVDVNTQQTLATFPLWQLTLVRMEPDNYDDQGSMGRPYLDASRGIWKKLIMTEEDQVLRRHMRAPLRMAHVLEGADDDVLTQYRDTVERDQAHGATTDYYLNRKGSVTALQGDQNLDQIKDIALLLDAFFSGAPAPKGLFGYADGMSRDILEDLKRDFYDELDALQDSLADVYRVGFELDLLLAGVNPLDHAFAVQFAERRTETPTQATDRALKVQATGASHRTVWEIANLDPDQELSRRADEAGSNDPYPDPGNIGGGGVRITPGNGRKGDSATTIAAR